MEAGPRGGAGLTGGSSRQAQVPQPPSLPTSSAVPCHLPAIQFVVNDRASHNNSITPILAITWMTACFLVLACVASVVISHVARLNASRSRLQDLFGALRRRRQLRKEWRQQQSRDDATELPCRGCGDAAAAGCLCSRVSCRWACCAAHGKVSWRLAGALHGACTPGGGTCWNRPLVGGAARDGGAPPPPVTSMQKEPTAPAPKLPPGEDAYYQCIAWIVNKACFVLFLICYPVAVVLLCYFQGWYNTDPDVFYRLPDVAAGAVRGLQPVGISIPE